VVLLPETRARALVTAPVGERSPCR